MVMWPNLGQLHPRRPSILPREGTKKRQERPHENHYVSVFKYLKLRFSSSKLGINQIKSEGKKRGKKKKKRSNCFSHLNWPSLSGVDYFLDSCLFFPMLFIKSNFVIIKIVTYILLIK